MKRVKLVIAYDGTGYSGWQVQDNAVTVAGSVTKAISDLSSELGVFSSELTGASRTDAGVHSFGNVAVFDTELPIPPERFAKALNARLPEDIRILSSEEVGEEFNPRYVKGEKTYVYRILNSDVNLPIYSRYTHHIREALDIVAMQKAEEYIIGEHDFTSFCSAGSQVQSKVRTVKACEVSEETIELIPHPSDRDGETSHRDDSISSKYHGIINIKITGDGFLYNMVRIIAGTLIEVGLGRRTPDSIQDIIAARDRSLAGPTAPAKGLTLIGIEYK